MRIKKQDSFDLMMKKFNPSERLCCTVENSCTICRFHFVCFLSQTETENLIKQHYTLIHSFHYEIYLHK